MRGIQAGGGGGTLADYPQPPCRDFRVSVATGRIEHMFETVNAVPLPPEGRGGVLDPAGLSDWVERLSADLDSASSLDDAGRVAAIRALERLACVTTAAQAQLSVELDVSQRQQAVAGVPAARQGRGVAAQVALARRESPNRGQRHLSLAKVVAAELPATWRAWRGGQITEWKATLIARETGCLSLADRLAVDAAVAGDPERLAAMGERALVKAVQAAAYELDPESFVTRRRNAVADRHVTLRPAPDTMTWLTALLPVSEGVATYAALVGSADSARAAGDPRSKGQLMADTLVASVVGSSGTADSSSDQPGSTHASAISLGPVMSDAALFGGSDEPALLEGFGPVPAELARELISGACDRRERVWLRRLYTHPATGELVSMDSAGRRFRHSLGRFLRLRDQVCRTPWCDAPIRHGDHAEDHAAGGPTSAVNGQGLCEACNLAKQAPGWRARPSRDPTGGHVVTTTTGHRYSSRPPIAATLRRTPIRLDLALTHARAPELRGAGVRAVTAP